MVERLASMPIKKKEPYGILPFVSTFSVRILSVLLNLYSTGTYLMYFLTLLQDICKETRSRRVLPSLPRDLREGSFSFLWLYNNLSRVIGIIQ